MIVHFDHITVAFSDFEKGINLFQDLGYKLRFKEYNLPNLEIKSGLLNNYSEKHHLAILDYDKNITVEVIGYDTVNESNFTFFPIIKNDSSCYFLNNIAELLRIKDFNLFNFNKIVLRVKNLKRSIDFWRLFGFNLVRQDKSGALLEFRSFFSRLNYYLYLKEGPKFKKNVFYLDDNNFNSLAFFSTSIESDRKIFLENNICVTEVANIVVNSKMLNVFFVRGGDGEIVEIVSININ